jgi:subtilisin family serine protease
VSVVLQLDSPPSGQLNALLERNGVHVRGNFTDLGMIAADLPAGVLDELANYPEVNFVSQDSPMHSFGYVTSTTGADAVRTESTTNGGLLGLGLLATTTTTTYDGTGIGIAIVDSGIDQSHASFTSRIAYNKDFTGENRVDDPYGHGTNVAGLALGLFTEWRFAPFIADNSLLYFVTHVHALKPITILMLALGAFLSYRLALGRDPKSNVA